MKECQMTHVIPVALLDPLSLAALSATRGAAWSTQSTLVNIHFVYPRDLRLMIIPTSRTSLTLRRNYVPSGTDQEGESRKMEK